MAGKWAWRNFLNLPHEMVKPFAISAVFLLYLSDYLRTHKTGIYIILIVFYETSLPVEEAGSQAADNSTYVRT